MVLPASRGAAVEIRPADGDACGVGMGGLSEKERKEKVAKTVRFCVRNPPGNDVSAFADEDGDDEKRAAKAFQKDRDASSARVSQLFEQLSPFQAKALKTGAVAAGVYGAIKAAEGMRAARSVPNFDDLAQLDLSKRETALFRLDYALAWAMFRIATVVERRTHLRGAGKQSKREASEGDDADDDLLFSFYEAARAVAIVLERALVDNDVRAANHKLKRAEARVDALAAALRSAGRAAGGDDAPRHAAVAADDAETVKACLAAHVKNSMIDHFF